MADSAQKQAIQAALGAAMSAASPAVKASLKRKPGTKKVKGSKQSNGILS